MRMVRRFGTDRSGAAAVVFGLSLLPLMGAVGAAVDYSRAASFHSRAQLAVDGAALAIVREPSTATAAEIQAKGEQYVRAALGHATDTARRVTLGTVTATRQGNVVKVAVASTVGTTVMHALGVPTMPVAASAEATWGDPGETGKIELALVLDNTGSMNDTIGGRRKIDELKSATTSLLGKLRSLATTDDKVKVSVVPFDTEVRLDPATYRSQPWFRFEDSRRWTGYVRDRYNAYAVSDAAPSTAIADSLFPAPAVSNNTRQDLATIRPLTSLYGASDYNAITAAVAGMQPRGNTNIALGVNWGLATLSSGLPFTEGVPKGTSRVKKIMIVLTDGDNTMNYVNGAQSYNTSIIDANTASACQMVKREDIEIYTIRLLDGNENLLRNCASTAGDYFNVQRAGELAAVFDVILNAATSTRLTH